MEKIPGTQPPEEEKVQQKEDNKEISKDTLGKKIKRYAKIGILAGAGLFPNKDTPSQGADPVNKIAEEMVQEKDGKYFIGSENRQVPTYVEYSERPKIKAEKESAEDEISRLMEVIENQKAELEKAKKLIGENPEYYQKQIANRASSIEYMNEILTEFKHKAKVGTPEAYNKLIKEIKDAYRDFDSQRDWMKNTVASKEYLDRLKKEYESTDGPSVEATQFVRGNRLTRTDYHLVEGSKVADDAEGHFLPSEDLVELPSVRTDESVGIHEFTHSMTYGDLLMSDKATELYKKSYTDEKLSAGEKHYDDNYKKTYGAEYYNNATERDARKKQLEYDMDRFGIKKYGEIFNETHYQKLLELQKEGKLSRGAEEFLRMTKPEYMEQIMNEIAANETGESTSLQST